MPDNVNTAVVYPLTFEIHVLLELIDTTGFTVSIRTLFTSAVATVPATSFVFA